MEKDYENTVESDMSERKIGNRKFKFRRLKAGVLFASLGLVGLVGCSKKTEENPSISDNFIVTETLDGAQPEVMFAWASDTYSKFCDDIDKSNRSEDIKSEDKNSIYISYYEPVATSYYDYKETNNEEFKQELLKNAKMLENELCQKTGNEKYRFANTPFIYSLVSEDGFAKVPYVKQLEDGKLPEGGEVVTLGDKKMVYVIYDYDQENNKALTR